jgi:peptidoglycan/xylan/chitin deacetylase (PgdA/CDA1 family)
MIMTRIRYRFAFLLMAAFIPPVVACASEPGPPKRVAMIFDDGPIPEQMPAFLELLAKERVTVSFAHVGRNVAAHPALTQRAAKAGHEIVNHSYTHPHFKDLDDAAIGKELRDTQAAVKAATGHEPRWFWVPFGDWDDRIAAAVAAASMQHYPIQTVHFISSEDWNREIDAATILRRTTTDVRDCTVLLFHEWREETLAQMPAIIASLKEQGCTFHTFSQLAEAARTRAAP